MSPIDIPFSEIFGYDGPFDDDEGCISMGTPIAGEPQPVLPIETLTVALDLNTSLFDARIAKARSELEGITGISHAQAIVVTAEISARQWALEQALNSIVDVAGLDLDGIIKVVSKLANFLIAESRIKP